MRRVALGDHSVGLAQSEFMRFTMFVSLMAALDALHLRVQVVVTMAMVSMSNTTTAVREAVSIR